MNASDGRQAHRIRTRNMRTVESMGCSVATNAITTLDPLARAKTGTARLDGSLGGAVPVLAEIRPWLPAGPPSAQAVGQV